MGIEANVKDAMGAWERLIAKEPPFDTNDPNFGTRSMWTESYHTAGNQYQGDKDWNWWTMHVGQDIKEVDGFAPAKLFTAIIPLLVARTSDAVSESAYTNIAQETTRYETSDARTHIFWANAAMWQFVRNSKCITRLS